MVMMLLLLPLLLPFSTSLYYCTSTTTTMNATTLHYTTLLQFPLGQSVGRSPALNRSGYPRSGFSRLMKNDMVLLLGKGFRPTECAAKYNQRKILFLSLSLLVSLATQTKTSRRLPSRPRNGEPTRLASQQPRR